MQPFHQLPFVPDFFPLVFVCNPKLKAATDPDLAALLREEPVVAAQQ